jgi:hypothetical protein
LDQLSPISRIKDKVHGGGAVRHPIPGLPSAGNDEAPCRNINARRLSPSQDKWGALIDRGANGCIAGRDMKVIETTGKTIDLSGIDDHTVRNLRVVTAGGVTRTPQGEVILIVHHAADMTGDARTILSAGQLESFGCKVRDKSPHVGKEVPSITTIEGYQIPISFKKGLPYIRLRTFDKEDWATLPHIHITSPQEWDPGCLDSSIDEAWYLRNKRDLPVIRDGILTDMGSLKSDPGEDLEDNDEDRNYQSVDRGSVR